MNNVFMTSDLHFVHKQIIDYENRPFRNVDEMNETLVINWNSVVDSATDKVFVLGDFCFGGIERTKEFLRRLNGYKILVKGCHDPYSVSLFMDSGFKEVYEYPIIYDQYYMLSHKPLYVSSAMPYANIHGHTHGNSFDHVQSVNVSVEVTEYKPLNFEYIKNRFK